MDTKQKVTIRYATPGDAKTLYKFRKDQYLTAREFQIVDTSALSKQKGRVILAEMDNTIISTIQFQLFRNREEFEYFETTSIPPDFDEFPTVYVSKGATAEATRRLGLNSLLRQLVLGIADEDGSVQSLCGVVYEHAPRIRLLHQIGYSFTVVEPELNYAMPVGNEFFICLPRNKFKGALIDLSNNLSDMRFDCEIALRQADYM